MRQFNQESQRVSRTLTERLRTIRHTGDERTYANAIIAQLAADRLLWSLAPVYSGGTEASVSDAANLVSEVAQLSGSAGLILAMHLSQVLALVRHGADSGYLALAIDRFVQSQILIASGTSEIGVGGDIYGSKCVIEEEENGTLRVIKESPNISYLDQAGALLITANKRIDGKKHAQVLFLAERECVSLDSGPVRGFMGMRGILNAPYKVDATFKHEAVFADEFPVIARQTMTPSIHIFWAALWSGLASAALRKVKGSIAADKSPDSTVRGHLQTGLSQLVDKHFVMNALIRDAIVEFDGAKPVDHFGFLPTSRITRLKTQTSTLLVEICVGALTLIGLRAYAEEGTYSLSEIMRDALSGPIMVSNHRLLLGNARIERFVEEAI